MANVSEERQAKKARLDTPSPPNSKTRPLLSDACFAMSSLGRAKLGVNAKSFCDVMPGVTEVNAPVTGTIGELNRVAATDSLKFKWASAPLLMLKLWILQKGLITLSLVPLTEASTAAVLGSMAALFSLVCGETVRSRDAALLPDGLPDSLNWAQQLVASPNLRVSGYVDFAVAKWDAKAEADCFIATYEFKHRILPADMRPNKIQVLAEAYAGLISNACVGVHRTIRAILMARNYVAIYECCLDEGSFNEIFAKYSGKQNAERAPVQAVRGQYKCVYADAFLGEDFSFGPVSVATFSAIFASTAPEAREMDEPRFCTYLKEGLARLSALWARDCGIAVVGALDLPGSAIPVDFLHAANALKANGAGAGPDLLASIVQASLLCAARVYNNMEFSMQRLMIVSLPVQAAAGASSSSLGLAPTRVTPEHAMADPYDLEGVERTLARVLGDNRAGVFVGFFRATGLRMESYMQLGFEHLKREIAGFAQRQKVQEAMAPLRPWGITMLEHIAQECDKP